MLRASLLLVPSNAAYVKLAPTTSMVAATAERALRGRNALGEPPWYPKTRNGTHRLSQTTLWVAPTTMHVSTTSLPCRGVRMLHTFGSWQAISVRYSCFSSWPLMRHVCAVTVCTVPCIHGSKHGGIACITCSPACVQPVTKSAAELNLDSKFGGRHPFLG